MSTKHACLAATYAVPCPVAVLCPKFCLLHPIHNLTPTRPSLVRPLASSVRCTSACLAACDLCTPSPLFGRQLPHPGAACRECTPACAPASPPPQLLALVATCPERADIFDELFQPGGNELHTRPARWVVDKVGAHMSSNTMPVAGS